MLPGSSEWYRPGPAALGGCLQVNLGRVLGCTAGSCRGVSGGQDLLRVSAQVFESWRQGWNVGSRHILHWMSAPVLSYQPFHRTGNTVGIPKPVIWVDIVEIKSACTTQQSMRLLGHAGWPPARKFVEACYF